MAMPTSFRLLAAVALTAGLFVVLPGCGGNNPQPQGDKKDKKEEPKPNSTPNPSPGTNPGTGGTPEVKAPERIDTKSGVGKDAVDFLSALGAGNAKASQLSSGFVKAVGLPAELPSDKARGYSTDAAEAWLKRVGSKLTGVGPMAESSQAGDVAIFRGSFTAGMYWLRMIKEGDAWKVDWLSMSSASSTITSVAAGAPTADALLQSFAAGAVAAVICDKDAMPKDDRIAVIAAGLSPTLRKSWADPFDGDKAKGYDFSPAKLAIRAGEIGSEAEAVAVSASGDAAFKVEVTRGGAKTAYTLKVVKGTTPGQWLVDSISP